MIKADIINLVAEDASITKVKAVEAVEAVFEAMKAAMERGERIELRGFGVFQVKPRKKGSAAILVPAEKFGYPRVRRSASSRKEPAQLALTNLFVAL